MLWAYYVPGLSYTSSHGSSRATSAVSTAILTRAAKLRLREGKSLTQSHTASGVGIRAYACPLVGTCLSLSLPGRGLRLAGPSCSPASHTPLKSSPRADTPTSFLVGEVGGGNSTTLNVVSCWPKERHQGMIWDFSESGDESLKLLWGGRGRHGDDGIHSRHHPSWVEGCLPMTWSLGPALLGGTG